MKLKLKIFENFYYCPYLVYPYKLILEIDGLKNIVTKTTQKTYKCMKIKIKKYLEIFNRAWNGILIKNVTSLMIPLHSIMKIYEQISNKTTSMCELVPIEFFKILMNNSTNYLDSTHSTIFYFGFNYSFLIFGLSIFTEFMFWPNRTRFIFE
ncbi:hypothetical protein BpHYR1_034311 [Brachionus plicatilis]|uniref:Uncharacterized protein n=1 Tax=Brachionus plicatilis TaxID=10195 RepID=A0A3M7RUR8_BRAPC|nr:hypothetical protein BpHYR1_034311 [Brachionus plicatilis]